MNTFHNYNERYFNYTKIINAIRHNIGGKKLFLCLDIEAFEYNQKKLTEFGWCIFKKDGTVIKRKHGIVRENLRFHNGKHVPNNRDYYLFGDSDIQNLYDIKKELKNDIQRVDYLVGQGIGNDLRYLRSIDINVSKFKRMKNGVVPEFGVIDTMDLYSGYFLTEGVSLEKSLIRLGIPYERLHNAGKYNIYIIIFFFIFFFI